MKSCQKTFFFLNNIVFPPKPIVFRKKPIVFQHVHFFIPFFWNEKLSLWGAIVSINKVDCWEFVSLNYIMPPFYYHVLWGLTVTSIIFTLCFVYIFETLLKIETIQTCFFPIRLIKIDYRFLHKALLIIMELSNHCCEKDSTEMNTNFKKGWCFMLSNYSCHVTVG